jgi:hypothetical protein
MAPLDLRQGASKAAGLYRLSGPLACDRFIDAQLTNGIENVTEANVGRLNFVSLGRRGPANSRRQGLTQHELGDDRRGEGKTQKDEPVSKDPTSRGVCFHGLTLVLPHKGC